MFSHFKLFFMGVGAVSVIIGIMLFADVYRDALLQPQTVQVVDTASSTVIALSSTTPDTQSIEPEISPQEAVSPPREREVPQTAIVSEQEEKEEGFNIGRVQNPYQALPYSLEVANSVARASLVNILCTSSSGGLRHITGSGIVIDSRGVVLTNAHVAQHVLLSQVPELALTCTIRHGSPARTVGKANVLYIPAVWISENAQNIGASHSTGSGEHDYALLLITNDDGSPADSLQALPLDAREGIGFPGDPVLTTSYPAEFLESTAAQFDLYPLTSITTIKELLTFETGSVDVLSVGATPGAQGGSSGGGIVNMWGYVIGVITTTSEGATTADRDLRALTANYINEDFRKQRGIDLSTILEGDVFAEAQVFKTQEAPALITLLLKHL